MVHWSNFRSSCRQVKEAEARFHQAAKVQAASGANRAILWERDPPHPTRLDLSGTPQNLRQFIEVAEALAKDVHVVTVSLDFCELGPRSGQALATAMLQNQKISTLTLDGNHIGPAGAVALFRSIADHGTLVQLDLKRNGLASDGGLALGRALAKNTTLTTLDVSWNSFGPSGAAAVLDALATNKTLRVLRFDGNDITPAGAQALSNGLRRNRGLEELYIAWNELGSAGGRALGSSLGENQQLRVLDVSGNALGDAGTLAVSDGLALNGTLLELVLDDNTIGGVGITGLARSLVANHQLQRLSLGWNSCDSGGAAALARALATNKALVHLDLSNNLTLGRGGEVEFAFGSLGEALRCNRGNFCSLNLHGAGAGPEGARALAAAVVGQTSFARYGKKASVVHQERHENASQPAKADEVATPASDAQLVCGQIEDARKGRSFGGTADRFVQTVNPKIKELIISGNNLGPNGAIALAQLTGLCRELRILHVGFNKNGPIPIGYEGSVALFKALAGYFVAQRDSESRSENSVPWWKEQVQHVVFSESEARLKELASQLEPDDCDNSVEESQFSIAERDSHTSVGAHGDTSASSEMLIGHGVDGHSAESQFISLASVAGAPTSSSADSDVAGPTGKVPGSILRLERLDMEGCLIGADAAIDLCEHLIAQRFTVATLNLNCCWLRLRGGHALALALRNNIPNLVHLDLSTCWRENVIFSAQFVVPAVAAFADVLLLCLGCNQLGPQNGSWLGDALALNAVLKRLSLYNNRIRCDGLVGLGRGLAKNKALEWLNLAANGIKGRGVREFSRLIAPNKTILHVCSRRGWRCIVGGWKQAAWFSLGDDFFVQLQKWIVRFRCCRFHCWAHWGSGFC